MQELLQRDLRIARWFIEERWGRKLDPASSLGHLLTLSEQLDLKGPAKTVDELDREVARHGLHLSAGLVRLAWAVRALHGYGGAVDLALGLAVLLALPSVSMAKGHGGGHSSSSTTSTGTRG